MTLTTNNNLLYYNYMVYSEHLFNNCKCDAPEYGQLTLQDPSSSIMEGILLFNKHLLFIIVVIVLAVGWLLFNTIYNFDYNNNNRPVKFFHSNPLEIVWTSLPALTLW